MTVRRSLVDRLLTPFTEVRAGEGVTALLLALNVFLILTAYYVVKVLREPLILASGGAEVKSYSAAGQALLLLVLVPIYGALATRWPRRRLIVWVTAFFVLCLAAFWVLARAHAPIGVPFFLWVGIFNLMVIAQFWAFANDVYTTDEGKRLFPIVAFGASAGAVVGSWLAGQLIAPLGLHQLLLVAAALLIAGTALTLVVDARERAREAPAPGAPGLKVSGHFPAATTQFRAESGEFTAVQASEAYARASGQFRAVKPGQSPAEEVRGTPNSFALVWRSPYLLPIAFLILLLNAVNSTGEYILGATVTGLAHDLVAAGAAGGRDAETIIGSFYAGYFSTVNLVGLLLQLFVVSRVLKFAGVKGALLVLPVVAFAGYAILAFVPVLAAIRWAKTAENALDYSLNNTVRNVLFLPTTREEKYSAKQAIDGFFVRAGDLVQAGIVYAGTAWLALAPRQFALINLALVALWIALAVVIGRRYDRLAAAAAG